MPHPEYPRSNIQLYRGISADSYALKDVSPLLISHEDLTPNVPPRLTGATVGKYLVPLTRELDEVPPRPTIAETSGPVIDRMVQKDKANWVDKPGVNDYELHDLFHSCGLKAVPHKTSTQAVFPRSYQYEWVCVQERRRKACADMVIPTKQAKIKKKMADITRVARQTVEDNGCFEPLPFWWFGSTGSEGLDASEGSKEKEISTGKSAGLPAHCRDCSDPTAPSLTAFQLSLIPDLGNKRWRDWPDVTAQLKDEEIAALMRQVGRPFMHDACMWYNEKYPSGKYQVMNRKFGK